MLGASWSPDLPDAALAAAESFVGGGLPFPVAYPPRLPTRPIHGRRMHLGCGDRAPHPSRPRTAADGCRGRPAVLGRGCARGAPRARAGRPRGLVPDRGLQRARAHPARPRRPGGGHAHARRGDRRQGAAGGERPGARAGLPGGRRRAGGRRRPRVRAGDQPRGGHRRARAPARRGAGRARAGRGRVRRARHGVRGHRQPAVHRPLRVGPALGSPLAGRGDPASPAAGRLHLRGRPVHARRVAGARRRGRWRHLRLRPGSGHVALLADGCHGA